MTVYVIVQLKMTDRAGYDSYQTRFFDVFRKFSGRLLARRFWRARGIATSWC